MKEYTHALLALCLVCALMLAPAPFSYALSEEASIIFGDTVADSAAQSTTEIYVSPTGDDAGAGTLDAPIQGLIEALQRALNASTADVVIYLRGGTYYFGNTMFFVGSTQKNITLRAYLNETPVFTGAQSVQGWQETQRFDQVVWAAKVEAETVRALYDDYGAKQPSRWPKNGYLQVEKAEQKSADKLENHGSFFANPSDLPASIEGATVRLLHWWKDELATVSAYDGGTGQLQLSRPTSMSVEAGNDYWLEYVQNVPLSPGEWVYSAHMQTLYYAPCPGETFENTTLYAAATETLLFIGNTTNVTFDRITFARTNWSIPNENHEADFAQAAYDASAAVIVQDAQHITFTSCHFRDIGAGCIQLNSIVQDATIFNCTFENVGAHAVYVHGENVKDTAFATQRITLENNEISGYGRNFLNSTAILIVHAREIDVAFNDIHDGTYTAISAGWVWGDWHNITDAISIRNNAIHNIGQGMLSDMGAVYLLGTQPNTVVSSNIIHDVISSEYGGWGIYLDEGSADILVQDNLVYQCSAQGFHQHGGTRNTVRNNIFALNADGQIGASGAGTLRVEQNILVGRPYLNIINTAVVRQKDNIKKPDASIFVDAASGNFAFVDPNIASEIDFVPWELFAGRYGTYAQSQ